MVLSVAYGYLAHMRPRQGVRLMAHIGTSQRWVLLEQHRDIEALFTSQLGVSPLVARVLAARGMRDLDEARAFLSPSLDRDWADPLQIPGMAEAADRVEKALLAHERIAVFGDFDVDGMSSTCLLTLGLRELGGAVMPYIPYRFGEGYGLSEEALNRVISHRTDVVAYGSQFFTESTPIAPRSPYSASKASADLLTLAYHHTYGLPVNITRCSNNYGPYHFPEKLIPLIINNTLHGKALPVYGRGLNVRDWLYVEDHCKAIDLVLRHGDVGEIYNVGGFNEQTNIDIVRQVIACIARIMRDEPQYRSLLSCPLERVNEELITFVTDRPGHDMRYAIDPTKIASTLGWYPETPFSVGLERTIRWNLDNHSWVQAVTSGDYLQYYEQQYANR